MKKTIYLMLALLMASLVSANAQVRIGGDNNPNESAILDLNESDKQTDGTKGLALPRVALTNSTVWGLEGDTPIDGMTVYNTSTSKENGLQGEGVYTWSGGKTGEWKSPSLTRNSVTVVEGGAAIEGGDVIFYSQHTKAPAALMAAFLGETINNGDDAQKWCASLGARLPVINDFYYGLYVPIEWSNLFATMHNLNLMPNTSNTYPFWLGNTIFSGIIQAYDTSGRIATTQAINKTPLYVLCVKDL